MYTLVVHNVAFKLLFVGQGREKKKNSDYPASRVFKPFQSPIFFFCKSEKYHAISTRRTVWWLHIVGKNIWTALDLLLAIVATW